MSALDDRRRQLGMTRRDVAVRAGVPPATVTRILTGAEESPRIANLSAIAAVLGVEVRLGRNPEIVETVNAWEFQKREARRKAQRLAQIVRGTMALEGQGVGGESLEQLVEATAARLLSGSKRRLWSG